MAGLRKIQADCRCIGDVRGLGLMVAAEMVTDPETKTPGRRERAHIIRRAFEKGLLLLGCGENSLRFCPALTVTRENLDTCLSIFDEALRASQP